MYVFSKFFREYSDEIFAGRIYFILEYLPRACTRGKVIGRVIVVVVVFAVVISTKIAISRDIGVYATCNHNKSIEFGKKLVSGYVLYRVLVCLVLITKRL